MELLLILGTIIIAFVCLFLLIRNELVHTRTETTNPTMERWLQSMQTSIEQTNRTLNEAMRGSTNDVARVLQANTRQLNERLDTAAQVIGDLKKNLGEMSEVGKGIRSLQEFLQSPKLRGNIGEQVLSDMIGQTFPKNAFHLQYAFHSGLKVDAVLKTDAGLLCIDSKFPMENFLLMHRGEMELNRKDAKKNFAADVKKHITDISKKYILPEEGTMDFALMYIPSESVYYEIVNDESLMSLARTSRVYPVSPNTLYAHLQVLLVSFQGKELEQRTKEVFQLLRAIQKDYEKIDEQLGTLGKHVTNAYNSMNTVTSGFTLLGQKLHRTKEISSTET